jgi:hypothetical protein
LQIAENQGIQEALQGVQQGAGEVPISGFVLIPLRLLLFGFTMGMPFAFSVLRFAFWADGIRVFGTYPCFHQVFLKGVLRKTKQKGAREGRLRESLGDGMSLR